MRTRSTLRFVLEGLEGLVCLAVAVLSWPVAGRWLRSWGSRSDERTRSWEGDDLVTRCDRTATRAISVAAPTPDVWQRVAQFGLERAGFYSYELLERLGGIPVRNVESVEPRWQSLAVGDEVLVHPRAGVRVSRIRPGAYVCFGVRTCRGEDLTAGPGVSWSIYVVPTSATTCRLLVRSCFEDEPRASLRRVLTGLEAALDSVMEQRMLRSIKRLCEAGRARSQVDPFGRAYVGRCRAGGWR